MASKATEWTPLSALLTKRSLRLRAGAGGFERGERYASSGRVRGLKASPKELSATVVGTGNYQIRMWVEEGALGYSCTCPMGEDQVFCKHCVAAGLEWLDGVARGPVSSARLASKVVDLRAFLGNCDQQTLVDLITERAAADELFEGKLMILAAKAASVPADLEPYRRAVESVIVVDDFVPYRSMADYSENVQTVIDSIEGLLNSGEGAEVIDLCEFALECVEDATSRVDDSDGYMSELRDQLVELHHQACGLAQPDPERLAERLFDWAVNSDWETLLDGATRYSDVLGEVGLARYRDLAAGVWAHVPAVEGEDGRDHSQSRFRITYIMEGLARLSGSVDDELAVKARDLTYAYHYVQIVGLLVEAGRFDDALGWARRGLAAFPERTDVRLRDVAATELCRAGREGEAMAVIWTEFEERPNLASYQLLHRHAGHAGSWQEWRQRALQLLDDRQTKARSARKGSKGPGMPSGGSALLMDSHPESSELVKVMLWENNVEAAWSQAREGGCAPSIWLQLATARQRDHPEDAIPIYQDEVERKIESRNNTSYADAVKTMRKVRTLMKRAGIEGEFAAYATELRARHKPKRNLMKMFEKEGW